MGTLNMASFAFLVLLVSFQTASSQCLDTNPETDSHLGCPDYFYTQVSSPLVSRSSIEFNITVNSRKIAFPPECAPGEQSCYENANYQGLPLCNGWSGTLKDVKVSLASCFPDCDLQNCPDCDFNVTISPSSGQEIENDKSHVFSIGIRAYNAMGNYEMTFQASESSLKKRVFSLQVNISDQMQGLEGDNAICPVCSSEKCDIDSLACGNACGSVYCSAPECLFDTDSSGAAESCCGDDSGEIFVRCFASSEIGWKCPYEAACCELPGSCAYAGNCYKEGKAWLVSSGEDKFAFCSSGAWYDCDHDRDTCFSCGFSWNNSMCCGDDAGEYYNNRICLSGCETNMTDRSCCTIGTACVYSEMCYQTGSIILLGGKNVTCEGGVWLLKSPNESVCYKGECNKKNKCELPCPGCIFKDYSCYGTNCEADYRDPDSHWTYCGACFLNWSSEDRRCCGDEEKEYWSPPCPNSNASYGCCSNPSERMDRNGECVIFCGTSMRANASVIQESMIPLDIRAPQSVDAEAGKISGFDIIVSTKGSHALHNMMLSFCGPFGFNSSPYVIEELRPGEEKVFRVELSVPIESLPGPASMAVYVSSSEMLGKRYKPVAVNILPPEGSSSDIYLAIVCVIVLIYVFKKLRSRRKPKEQIPEKGTKVGKSKVSATQPGKREAAHNKLAQVVKEELDSGKTEKEIRDMLASNGFKEEDIRAALRQARKKLGQEG